MAGNSSLGIFAQWQSTYAQRGITTIPCSAKKQPLVKHPQRFGYEASKAIASRFPDAPAIGFYTGSRNRITVLDVDTTDERILRDALDRHGSTSLIVRTASGKFHGYYRHNGERRKIRPWRDRQLPIDLLGAGLCIAAPSMIAKGIYEITQGSLDDLDRLPILRGLDASLYVSTKSPPIGSTKRWEEMRDHDGRNKALFEQLARDAHHCDDFEQLVDRAKTLNEQFAQPLGDEEVMKIAASVWKMTIQGRNRFGQHGAWLPTADVDALISDPYQLALVGYLKAHNAPHSTFWVADGLGEKLGWPRRKFKTARQRIVQTGVIVPLSKPRPGRPVAYRWGRPGSPHSITSKPSYPLS